MLPHLDGPTPRRYPVLGAFLQRRGGTHATMRLPGALHAPPTGMASIFCKIARSPVSSANAHSHFAGTNRGRIACNTVGVAVAGHSSLIAEMAGFRLPVTSLVCRRWCPNRSGRSLTMR